jgi:phosphomannomutase
MKETKRTKEIKALNKEFFKLVEFFTPQEIKDHPFFNLDDPNEFTFTLTKEIIEKFRLHDWLNNYEKEAKVSTGGIRGPQNVLYPWDTRFPINQMGMALATLGKALVLRDQIKDRPINKIVSGEVRYNTKQYVELISRLEAALDINVHVPFKKEITSIWMASFLIFINDYDGGEYVTSSHAVSTKIATKDLDNQGGQFLPEMSLAFIAKIKEIFQEAEHNSAGYTFKFSRLDDKNIIQDFDGFDLYADYLKKGAATPTSLNLIKEAEKQGLKIIFDTVGGCMYKNLPPVLERLGILDTYQWRNQEVNPFFHGVGKVWRLNNQTGKKEYFDFSCDSSLLDVVKTMGYEEDLKTAEIGQIVLMTDPDGDRLVIGQVDGIEKINQLNDLGIDYIEIDKKKIYVFYHPAFTFLLAMDFYAKQLKAAGLWNNHSRVMISTAPSPRSWDEWAKNQGVKVITTPVGFKDIQAVMKKIEKQVLANPADEVVLTDIFNQKVNLGADPRLIFAGEESGAMIISPEEMIVSVGGRKAISMREKSAGEASITVSALAADLYLKKKSVSDYLLEIFAENNMNYRYYFRDDIIYYNESEPDPDKMKKDKAAGEVKRDLTDRFFLGITLALRGGKINLETAKKILAESFSGLNFSDLQDVAFVGDSTYLKFEKMFVMVRRSGTDAKMRGYSCGNDKERCQQYLDRLLHYDGALSAAYSAIPKEVYDNIYPMVDKLYKEYLYQDL